MAMADACCLWPAVNKGEEEMNYEGERRSGAFIMVRKKNIIMMPSHPKSGTLRFT